MAASPILALLRALRVFFKHDLVVQRAEGGMRVALEDRRAAGPKRLSRAEQAAQREQRELDLARRELAELLDGDASFRSTMRHLAFVEDALGKKGWRALSKVPLDVLQLALRQLEGLVSNWSPEGLACLRSKMAVALIDREYHNPEAEADNFRTAAVLDSPPTVAAKAIRAAKATAGVEVTELADDVDSPADDAQALLAAYAAMGVQAEEPLAGQVELHGELDSPSAKALVREARRAPPRQALQG